MFELQRAETALSYDFMSFLQHRALYAPSDGWERTSAWGVELTHQDVANAMVVLERHYNEHPAAQMSVLGRTFAKLILELESGVEPSACPPALIPIARKWLEREAEVKAAYREMMLLLPQYGKFPETQAETYAFLHHEIDGMRAVDEPTQKLVSAIRKFGYTPPCDASLFDIKRALFEFPELSTLPWFWHPEKPNHVGIVTNLGLLWLNGLPIECSPWSDYSVSAAIQSDKAERRNKMSVIRGGNS